MSATSTANGARVLNMLDCGRRDWWRAVWRVVLTIVATLAFSTTGGAQTVVHSLDQLRTRVRAGEEVIVTSAGHQTHGRVGAISSSSLGLIVDGVQTDFPERTLDTVSRRDSRWNGTLWGLGIGAGIGVSFDRGLVKEYGRDDISAGDSAAFILTAAGAGAGIGFLVDALIKGTEVIYNRPQTSANRQIRWLPMWTTRRGGVLVSLRF